MIFHETLLPKEVIVPEAAEADVELLIDPGTEELNFREVIGPDGEMVLESIVDQILEPPSHSSNLAAFLDNDELVRIGHDVKHWIELDRQARMQWQNAYAKQLDLLGLNLQERRTEPFDGACNYVVPIATEALVRFQSQTIQKTFPPEGPVKIQIMGVPDKEKEAKGKRVRAFMNLELTKSTEYRRDTERLLWGVGKAGCGFRKIWKETNTDGSASVRAAYIPAQDVYLPYGTQSLDRAERISIRVPLTNHELERMQRNGTYLDVKVSDVMDDYSPVRDKQDRINKEFDPGIDRNPVVYECSCFLSIMGDEHRSPYLVTVDGNGTVLAIYRNWYENDTQKNRLKWLVQYDYVPADDTPYSYGVLHLTGQSAQAASGSLRQLLDAGTFSMLNGGFKAKEARLGAKTNIISPGTYQDVDYAGNLRDAFMPLPSQQPSPVIAELMNTVTEAGRRIGSIADAKIGDIGAQAPVGTTLALMEDAMMVVSAVQSRIYASMSEEFSIFSRLYRETLPDEKNYDLEEAAGIIHSTDFDDSINIIPVADPRTASRAQQVTAYSTAIQLSAQAPQVYDLPRLHRDMLSTAGVADVDLLIPEKADAPALGPEAELMAILTGKPVKAHRFQDHQAHLTVLTNFKQDPETAKYVGQSVNANVIAAAMDALIQEHYAYLYLAKVEEKLGVPLPPLEEPLPPQIQQHLAEATAAASQKVLASDQAKAAAQEAQAKAQDPLFQLEVKRLEIEERKLAQKDQETAAKLNVQAQADAQRDKTEQMRIASNERIATERSIDEQTQFLAELKADREKTNAEIEKLRAEVKLLQAKTLQTVDSIGQEDNGRSSSFGDQKSSD